MSTTKNVIKIDENGPSIVSNGNIIANDLKLTLKDYMPEVTNWTTWNGILNKGDEINITTPYKFIGLRARNKNANTDSTLNPSKQSDIISACLPNNISLASNCGCNAGTEETSDIILNFEMNQYTKYILDNKTIYSDNELIFDCSHGSTASGVTGWIGCTCIDIDDCGTTGATGATGQIGITGGIGGTCDIGATSSAKGVYVYSFTGYLKDNNIVIKTNDAESEYVCKLDYYAYIKVDNEYILYIFDDTSGKWVLVKLDQKISDIIQNKITFNIIELIEWSESSHIYKSSNITLPSATGYTGTNTYTGSISELDSDMPINYKVNSLLLLESETFTGTITSKVDNLDVNVILAI